MKNKRYQRERAAGMQRESDLFETVSVNLEDIKKIYIL